MRKWIPALLILAGYALSLAVYRQLPDVVALDLRGLLPVVVEGRPDYLSRPALALGLPSIAIVLWLLLHEAPVSGLGRLAGRFFQLGDTHGSPLSVEYHKFAPSYRLIVAWTVSLVLSMHVAVLAAALSWRIEPGMIVGIVFGVGLVLVGNVMPRLRPNPVAGIRTNRTMHDPRLWARVHRIYGAMWVLGGIVVLIVAIVAPRYALLAGLVALVASSLGMLVAPRGFGLTVLAWVLVASAESDAQTHRGSVAELRIPSSIASVTRAEFLRADTLPPTDVRESPMEIVSDGLRLPGTLTVPATPRTGKLPVVLIVAGSGPTDRQGNAVGTPVRPFLYARLAWGLAERGIASLRYDKRG